MRPLSQWFQKTTRGAVCADRPLKSRNRLRVDDASVILRCRGPLERQPAQVHAERLRDWVGSSFWKGARELTAQEIQAAYREMCAEQFLEPRAWAPIASALARLIRLPERPLKTYRWAVDPSTGVSRRQRIYVFTDPTME